MPRNFDHRPAEQARWTAEPVEEPRRNWCDVALSDLGPGLRACDAGQRWRNHVSVLCDQIRGLVDAYGRWSHSYATVLDPTLEQMARDTVELARIVPGQNVLDLASGTGAIARAAAMTEARVFAVDLSREMMATACDLSRGLVAYAVADAGQLPFRARAFDAVTCGLSLSHFTDVQAVLVAVRQVLRPRGVFVASAWGSSGSDRSFSAAFSVYRRYTNDVPRPFSALLDERNWSDPNLALDILARSGLASPEAITRKLIGAYPSAAAALEWAFAWPLTAAGLESQVDPARREALLADALAAIEAAGELRWEREVHYYRATVPGGRTAVSGRAS
jgi:SAM-dependent methyltransferase